MIETDADLLSWAVSQDRGRLFIFSELILRVLRALIFIMIALILGMPLTGIASPSVLPELRLFSWRASRQR